MTFRSALYRGELMHARHDELARRAFTYPVYVASIDPSELPRLHRELRLFSHGGRNLFSLDERDYSTPFAGTTRVITNLKTAGYVFNPVSFFLRYTGDAVASAIAEVNNTYGGNHRYTLDDATRLPGDRIGFRQHREFFVSPFLHGDATYDFYFDAPLDGDTLAIEMLVHRDARRIFTARLTATRTPLSDRALLAAAIRYPLMTAQVIGLIHWQALKLRVAGVPYRRPGPDHRPLAL